MKKTTLSALKAGAAPLVLGLSLISTGAFAQDNTAQDDEESASSQAIVVTGSRIPRVELESVSPVTTVGAEQIELTGTVTVESLINDLPQVIPGNNRTSNNSGGENFSTLDLRGLGPQRTLILVDGERLAASSTSGVTDVSQIPTGLIQRVDVVTGGATAVYGSDAMAGVINFVLKKDYEGAEISAQAGVSEGGKGFNFNVQGLIGGNFADGRGNVTVSASYYDRDPVGQGEFDYSRISGALGLDANNRLVVVDDPSDIPGASSLVFPGGSGTNPFGTVVNSAANPFRNLATLLPATFGAANTDCNTATPGVAVNGGSLSFDPQGRLIPQNTSGFCQIPIANSSRYNFAPQNLLQIPFSRLNLATTARYEISDSITTNIYATYARTQSTVNLAPTPAAGGTGFTIPYDSPLIPADLAAALASRPNPTAPFSFNRRFAETGPRIGINENNSFQIRNITDIKLSDNWNASAVLSYGRTDFDSRNIGNINRTAVEAGLNGCRTAAGAPTGFGVPEGCIPINIFGANRLTPAMVKFIQTDTTDTSQFEQVRAAFNLNGTLFEVVEGDPIGVALGAEVRKDSGASNPDDAKVRGEIIGFNQQNALAGEINVKEFYGEARLPLLARGDGGTLLSLEAGARYSDYSTVGGLFNYKFGGELQPFDWVKFRGSYNRAARAPAVFELFQNGDQGFPTYIDPCNDTASRTAAILARCQAQAPGFNFTGFQQNNSQVQAFAFGNPNLKEERAETWTVGAVLTPGRIVGGNLTATIDYYNIKITQLNQALGAGYFLLDCYTNGVADSCARIVRNTSTGQVDRVNTTRLNSDNTLATSGIDVALKWSAPFAGGRLRIDNLFTYVDSYKLGGTEFVDKAFDGIGGVTSRYANTLTVGYDKGKFTGQARWVYKRGGTQYDALFGEDADSGFITPRIPDLHSVDLSARYRVTDNVSLSLIVDNVLNKLPPQTATGTFEQANTNVSFYEPYLLGRGWTIQATVRF